MPLQTPCGLASTTSGIPLLIFVAFILLPSNHIIGEQTSVVPDEGPSGKNRSDTLKTSVAYIIAETARLYVLNLGVIIFP